MRFKQFLFLLSLILLPLFVGSYYPSAARSGRQLMTSLIQPVLETTNQFGKWTGSFRDFLLNYHRLYKENEILNEKINGLKNEVAVLKEAGIENDRLRRLLNFKENGKWKMISAQVIAYDLSPWSYYVTINKGSSEGISDQMPLVVGDGLIGKITSVTKHASHAILLLDLESRVSAMVQETRDIGLIEGTGRPLLKMTYLDLHAAIQVGQTVITSGSSGIYPKGVPIGQIVQVGRNENNLSLYAEVKPFASFSKLEEVACLDVREVQR